MYDHIQEERLDNLQEDLVSCIEGDEGQGGRFVQILCSFSIMIHK